MDLLSSYRANILAIPAYHLLTLLPHALAISIGRHAYPGGKWDNRNPRGAATSQNLAKKLDADSLAAFERARACSLNGFENLPLFAAAVVLGNVGGVDEAVLNTFVLTVLGLRVAYTVAYLGATTRLRASARSLTWGLQIIATWRMFFLSAKAFAAK